MNKLNGQPAGWDVSLEDVERALRHLEATYAVECMWRLKETPIPAGRRSSFNGPEKQLGCPVARVLGP